MYHQVMLVNFISPPTLFFLALENQCCFLTLINIFLLYIRLTYFILGMTEAAGRGGESRGGTSYSSFIRWPFEKTLKKKKSHKCYNRYFLPFTVTDVHQRGTAKQTLRKLQVKASLGFHTTELLSEVTHSYLFQLTPFGSCKTVLQTTRLELNCWGKIKISRLQTDQSERDEKRGKKHGKHINVF